MASSLLFFSFSQTIVIMRGLVLLLSMAIELCGAWSRIPIEPVTCAGERQEINAVRFAIQEINKHQNHGYKFQIAAVLAFNVDLNPQGCSMVMQLNLQETQCHNSNPLYFEDCEVRDTMQTKVNAGCVVIITVKDGQAQVLSHKCETTKDTKLAMSCPFCPALQNLDDEKGLKYISAAVRSYNNNSATDNYFVLQDVGRILSMYIMSKGMKYVTEFAMVETHCPVGTRINPEACRPLCADRARHVFCKTADMGDNHSIECESYPAVNKPDLGPDENEPICPEPMRFYPNIQCTERPSDQATHPICSWTSPQPA